MNLDRILNKHMVPVEQDEPVRSFRCDQEEYRIELDPNTYHATYVFDVGGELNVRHLTLGHVEYYLSSGYWIEA